MCDAPPAMQQQPHKPRSGEAASAIGYQGAPGAGAAAPDFALAGNPWLRNMNYMRQLTWGRVPDTSGCCRGETRQHMRGGQGGQETVARNTGSRAPARRQPPRGPGSSQQQLQGQPRQQRQGSSFMTEPIARGRDSSSLRSRRQLLEGTLTAVAQSLTGKQGAASTATARGAAA